MAVINSLRADNALFRQVHITVLGDIAFDRNFLAIENTVRSKHTYHARERIFDIPPSGDDLGTVGSANCMAELCRSLGASVFLLTAVGDDPEGGKIREILAAQAPQDNSCLVLPRYQTPTKLRFFLQEDIGPEGKTNYQLRYRFDKDPMGDPNDSNFLDILAVDGSDTRLRESLQKSDALVLADTEKNILTSKVIQWIGSLVHDVRKTNSKLKVIVDPKNDWDKFKPLPVDVFVPSQEEAERAVALPSLDYTEPENLRTLGERLYSKFHDWLPTLVVTLRSKGAVSLSRFDHGATLTRYPGFSAARVPTYHAPMHCGGMFTAALALAMTKGFELDESIVFGNCVGSLQSVKPPSKKVELSDLINEENFAHLGREYSVAPPLPPILDEKENIAMSIIAKIGPSINVRDALYTRSGAQSTIIASADYNQPHLDELADKLSSPGKVVFISGGAASGKTTLLENLAVFVPGFDEASDKYNGYKLLVSRSYGMCQ